MFIIRLLASKGIAAGACAIALMKSVGDHAQAQDAKANSASLCHCLTAKRHSDRRVLAVVTGEQPSPSTVAEC